MCLVHPTLSISVKNKNNFILLQFPFLMLNTCPPDMFVEVLSLAN